MEYGKIIKAGRMKKGISQTELAARLGISKSAISNYESGRRGNIPAPTLMLCADMLDIPRDEFGLEARNAEPVRTPEAQLMYDAITVFQRLNVFGKVEAVKRLGELAELPRYQSGATIE